MQDWLQRVADEAVLSDRSRDYCLRRGATSEVLSRLGIFTWESAYVPPLDPDLSEASGFIEKFGDRGQGGEWRTDLNGWLSIPVATPAGKIIGLEFRNTEKKDVRKYHLSRSHWNPVWVGIQEQMEKIISGADIYVVEGLFDLFAMLWVVPECDVVLSTERAGFTLEHKRFIQRWMCPTAWCNMVYDNDEAGRRAIHGDEQMHLKGIIKSMRLMGVDNVREIRYSGKDPGEIWDLGGEHGLRSAFRL